ncbi:uncharacterized protein LOC117830473 [Lates japonicus]|uniref:Uncharacterized protein n=1 Tax=Lates japonicus TaxID=270547 RepID=A0AAD3MNL2_LATJO|nr:uncharacterized protein AKAME5_002869700 [Lates japonicus]
MSSADTPTKGSEPKNKEAASRLCPTSCGSSISGRDPHPMCIACIGAEHAQALLADPQSCPHCVSISEKILERQLRVAVANNQDPSLSGATPKAKTSTHLPRAAPMLNLQTCEELLEGEICGEEAEGDTNSDLGSPGR